LWTVIYRCKISSDASTEQLSSHARSSITVITRVCGRLVWQSVGKKVSLQSGELIAMTSTAVCLPVD